VTMTIDEARKRLAGFTSWCRFPGGVPAESKTADAIETMLAAFDAAVDIAAEDYETHSRGMDECRAIVLEAVAGRITRPDAAAPPPPAGGGR
jgi:hypothetical protein